MTKWNLDGLIQWRRRLGDAPERPSSQAHTPLSSQADPPLPERDEDDAAARNRRAADKYVQRAQHRSARIRGWRRRVLVKKGARIHQGLVERADQASLAILDAAGFVVSWYETSRGGEHTSNVLDRHVAQFYIPDDIAMSQPLLDLDLASVQGGSIQQAWRRRSGGSVFWSTTTIQAIRLRDGRLQGFTFLMRASQGPREIVRAAQTSQDFYENAGDLLRFNSRGFAVASCA